MPKKKKKLHQVKLESLSQNTVWKHDAGKAALLVIVLKSKAKGERRKYPE